MRYIGIDYGLRRVGLAICDAGETIVSPLQCVSWKPPQAGGLLARLGAIIAETGAEALVVGLPLNMDGSEGEQARLTRVFGKALTAATGLTVHYQDERLSSETADAMLAESGLSDKKRRAKRDMLAACTILGDFLGH